MTVYVDDWRQQATVGRIAGQWSRLFAGPWDDPGELHQLAARIGLRRAWYQDKPWPRGHYDVTEPKRLAAIRAGAVPVSWKETGRMMAEAKDRGIGNPPPARPRPASGTTPAPVRILAIRVRALTVKQPWAYAITDVGKRTENGTWRLPQGFLWLHAGARSGWDSAGPRHRLLAAAWHERHGPGIPLARDTDLIPFGAIVALIRVTGSHHATNCAPGQVPGPGHDESCDEWAAAGQVHNGLELAAVLPEPVPADGRQGLWPLPPATESACRAQLAPSRARTIPGIPVPERLQLERARDWPPPGRDLACWCPLQAPGEPD